MAIGASPTEPLIRIPVSEKASLGRGGSLRQRKQEELQATVPGQNSTLHGNPDGAGGGGMGGGTCFCLLTVTLIESLIFLETLQ